MEIQIATLEQLKKILKPIEIELQELRKNFVLKEPEDWMSRADVAKLLDIAYPTLHDWCNKSILKKYKIGSRTYFKRSEIEAVLNNSNRTKNNISKH